MVLDLHKMFRMNNTHEIHLHHNNVRQSEHLIIGTLINYNLIDFKIKWLHRNEINTSSIEKWHL